MYAVIEDSGQQFRVSEGDVLDLDVRELGEDATRVEFDRVLLISGEDGPRVGTPLVDGAKVIAEVVEQEHKGPKVHSFKMRRRKGYRRMIGHRQKYVRVRVTEIVA